MAGGITAATSSSTEKAEMSKGLKIGLGVAAALVVSSLALGIITVMAQNKVPVGDIARGITRIG